MISIRPSILLTDFEPDMEPENKKEKHPLSQIIKKLRTMKPTIRKDDVVDALKLNGFYHIKGNLYLTATIDSLGTASNVNRDIEDYFPDDFLNHPYGKDRKEIFNGAPNFDKKQKHPNSEIVYKERLSHIVQSNIDNPSLFQNFSVLFSIFQKIQIDYEKKIMNSITEKTCTVMFSLLDSEVFMSQMMADQNDKHYADYQEIKNAFQNKYDEYLESLVKSIKASSTI